MKAKKIVSTMALLLFSSGLAGCGAETSSQEVASVQSPLQQGQFVERVNLPATLRIDGVMDGCSNHPGPFITLGGEMSLGSIGSVLQFQNNLKGTHVREEPTSVSVGILNGGESVVLPKQPPLGGVGGNPHIYLQLTNGNGLSLSAPIYLGRCVQGLFTKTVQLPYSAMVAGQVTGGSCQHNPGPWIELQGEIALSGIHGKLIFQNNEKGTHTNDENDVEISFVLLPEGQSIRFSKQPPLGGVGGNPHIFLHFLNTTKTPATDWYIGRCVQLGD